ncbi:DUF72 domain-containing protein [Caldithrix abyssi]|uniref:Uncharacterized conserved protein YecE, DUF72 family n=1 Tax=Caldithrix abyssi DSM 13497 TaxID=880073 RepID=H1XTQ9_CALAY|nr:DUF72 domain-containing protein [Caldithrix abyssi]APF17433.1 Uncharacterized conserved protein YecE, DUF72 family [Caldithrix abyssi DSM 13497]EHO41534.1 protein of unknown function DUF72 [Caldithrix abyssi DSM 13497]
MDSPEIHIDVKIGTSGYSYEDWRSHFYPANLSKSKFLEFYAQFFNAVEINSTYYAIPNSFTIRRMVEKTPPNFCFIVKTHQETTHRRQENSQAIAQLLNALKPMIDSGKFHGFLAQFPYSFKNNEENRKYLLQTRELLQEHPLFVEFRHISWITPPMYQFLEQNNIGYVNVDEPQLPGLLPPQALATTRFGYVRFHGRNAQNWWEGKGSARYDYLYTEEELEQWMGNIRQLLQKTYRTYIFFNNHPRGQAIKNARQMLNLIQNQLNIFND